MLCGALVAIYQLASFRPFSPFIPCDFSALRHNNADICDWGGRFLLYILPLIGIFSGIGRGRVFQLITDRMRFKFPFFGKIQ